MRIVVLGHTGMIGRYCFQYLSQSNREVVGYSRNDFDAREENVEFIRKDDIVVNCVGIIKPYINKVGIVDTIKINTIFPHILAERCKLVNARMIHICSDCVYSGAKGQYEETDVCDATDVYARTKMLVPEDVTVIRTSVIGEDLNSDGVGFLQWLLKQEKVDGYTNCMWNGMTALQLAKIIETIIKSCELWKGVRHVYSKDSISKHDLCTYVAEIYKMTVSIKPVKAASISGTEIDSILDRTLSTRYTPYDTDTIYNQIVEMEGYDLK
tara:strand:- start:510 stop:1313 length:804 start_codon:yes stop_codon:yes gene_type:complete